MKLPIIGFGTFELKGKACREGVRTALEIGYRHIDTAIAYDNHKEVAKGIQGFPRNEFFLTSKFMIDLVLQKKNIDQAVEDVIHLALEELQTDYLDLMLIHWPKFQVPLEEILAALNRQTKKEYLRAAGVSNYTRHHLQDAYNAGLKVLYNQVEFHPYLYQKELLEFCRSHGTQLIAYRSLGQGALLKDPLIHQVAKNHQRSPAQVLLRWAVQKEVPVIPKATSPERIRENFAIFDFSLSTQEMAEIDKLNRSQRFCEPDAPVFKY